VSDVLAQVRSAFRDDLATYVVGDVMRVPMPAVVVSGSRPAAS
jgi:hypothetical protein